MPERLSRLRFGIRFTSRDAGDARDDDGDDEDDDELAPTVVSCLPGGVACNRAGNGHSTARKYYLTWKQNYKSF